MSRRDSVGLRSSAGNRTVRAGRTIVRLGGILSFNRVRGLAKGVESITPLLYVAYRHTPIPADGFHRSIRPSEET